MRKQQRQRRKAERKLSQRQKRQSDEDPLKRASDSFSSTSGETQRSTEKHTVETSQISVERSEHLPTASKNYDQFLNAGKKLMNSEEPAETENTSTNCDDSKHLPTENMPSPSHTHNSEDSTQSHMTFHSLDTDIDHDTTLSPKNSEEASSTNHPSRVYVSELQRELEITKNRLYEVETRFSKFRAVSRKEQEESSMAAKMRRETDELNRKLEEELTYYQELYALGKSGFDTVAKDELRSLHRDREELRHTCAELRHERDMIVREIDEYSRHYQNLLRSNETAMPHLECLQKSYEHQLLSLQKDIHSAISNVSKLGATRDEIINEMVLLNTKNAELTSMNNDISRRVSEREREAMAVMAGTSFLSSMGADTESTTQTTRSSASSSDAASEPKKLFGRRSAEHPSNPSIEPPKLFKFKRTNVFGMLGRSKKTDESLDTIISVPYDTIHSESEPEHAYTSGVGLHATQNAQSIWFMHAVPTNLAKAQQHQIVIFGNDLRKQVQIEGRTVPLVVRKCIEAVEVRGMDFEGIYRKSGGAGQMRLIQQGFEQEQPLDMCDEDQCNDICAVTSVLKQYFRDLPNPLFTHELHSEFMTSISKHPLYV
ncbi:Rho-type gtpase-activating protein [Apophysomyces sp. BC1034]|nr:Rho-type gtpase-activating protein [Apophysomyces sp. BC1021]KAG0187180.1 Rho-type gtpase-activating protein [Apophysomyces sp. BC1034]